MGRPLNKRYFGADANNNIKVQFHNGTSSVKGYIVKQTGSKRFVCSDVNGNTATCYLVDKASADLAAGEMTITVKYDDGTAQQITKISGMLCTVDDTAMHWTFDTSTTDGYVQIEEAGDNTSMTSSTDLEGDDFNGDYPVPGSAAYKTGATALNGITYTARGTPASPGGAVTTITNSASGLWRRKYNGNFSSASNSAPSTWNYSFFSTATFIKAIADNYVSWGQQTDGAGLGEHNFSMEWLGYVKVPTTQNYNIYAESDDHIAVWIGTAATNAPSNSTKSLGGNNQSLPSFGASSGVNVNTNSVTLDSTKWYPVRIWFSEHTGGCKAQVYFQGADGTTLNGHDLVWAYNTATGGF